MAVFYARTGLRAGMLTCAQQFSVLYPTLARTVHQMQPTRFTGDTPLCFLDINPGEAVLHTSGTQQRVFTAAFVFVMAPQGTNEQQVALEDEIVDSFLDHLKAFGYLATSTAFTRATVSTDSIEFGTGEVWPTVRVSLDDVTVMTGRSD